MTTHLFYVKYRDHILFKNTDPILLKPSEREVVGWLVKETDEAVYLCHDRSVESHPFEKSSESGLIILKTDILERKRIE
jgi:hypothetical protein